MIPSHLTFFPSKSPKSVVEVFQSQMQSETGAYHYIYVPNVTTTLDPASLGIGLSDGDSRACREIVCKGCGATEEKSTQLQVEAICHVVCGIYPWVRMFGTHYRAARFIVGYFLTTHLGLLRLLPYHMAGAYFNVLVTSTVIPAEARKLLGYLWGRILSLVFFLSGQHWSRFNLCTTVFNVWGPLLGARHETDYYDSALYCKPVRWSGFTV